MQYYLTLPVFWIEKIFSIICFVDCLACMIFLLFIWIHRMYLTNRERTKCRHPDQIAWYPARSLLFSTTHSYMEMIIEHEVYLYRFNLLLSSLCSLLDYPLPFSLLLVQILFEHIWSMSLSSKNPPKKTTSFWCLDVSDVVEPAVAPRKASCAKVFYVSDDSDTFLDVDDEAEDDAGMYIFCFNGPLVSY